MAMNRFPIISVAIATLSLVVSCSKTNDDKNDVSDETVIVEPIDVDMITIEAIYEEPESDKETKLSISEGVSSFNLLWEGSEDNQESMTLGTSTNTATIIFKTKDSGSTTATFEGTKLPDAGKDGETPYENTNYIGIVSSFGSTPAAGARGDIRRDQVYAGSSLRDNCFLVARADNQSVGSLSTLSFKTMNAFLRFSLKKGDSAGVHEYTHMYLTSIRVDSVNEEQISGRFQVSKTEDNWEDAYTTSGISSSDKYSYLTLDCTDGGATDGVELTDEFQDFYIVLAFGTYAKGLKVTFNVENQSGELGEIIGYISKNASYTIDRNTLVRMPNLAISPSDVSSEIVLWSENWNGGSNDQLPSAYQASGTGTFVYGGGSVVYSEAGDGDVKAKLKTGSMSAGGTSPELMLTAASNTTWTITGIPAGGYATLSLTFGSNNGSVVTTSTDGVTVSADDATKKAYTITTGGKSAFDLTFAKPGTSTNTRIDNIKLIVK